MHARLSIKLIINYSFTIDYVENLENFHEKMKNFIIEVQTTAIHCKDIIDKLCGKKKKYDDMAKAGTL